MMTLKEFRIQLALGLLSNEMKEKLAYTNTSIEILEKLFIDKDSNVRCSVAENPNTPVKILEKLSIDNDPTVKSCVAGNLNTPIKILEKLSMDKDLNELEL